MGKRIISKFPVVIYPKYNFAELVHYQMFLNQINETDNLLDQKVNEIAEFLIIELFFNKKVYGKKEVRIGKVLKSYLQPINYKKWEETKFDCLNRGISENDDSSFRKITSQFLQTIETTVTNIEKDSVYLGAKKLLTNDPFVRIIMSSE